MTPQEKLELLLDLVAEALIESPLVLTPTTVENNQTFIRNGLLQKGAGEGVLALFQKEIKANQEDINSEYSTSFEGLASQIDFENYDISVEVQPDNDYPSGYKVMIVTFQNLPHYDITNFVQSFGDNFSTNPLNVSQFIPLKKQSSIVDVEKAEDYLDTNIFELLPTGDTRQARIIRFFQELNALLPPNEPQFDLDSDGFVDRGSDNNWTGSLDYSKDNSISYAQDNQDANIDEEDAFIHRLKQTANDTNSTRTIEDIYNTIEPYLKDILEDKAPPQDDRPEYQNQSSGYLQFRNLNQGIIIRNTNQDFVEGLDPNNPTYLETGFTITMWVRFLNKVSEGTLFNFGNPLRDDNPFGFTLETLVDEDSEKRYLRLLVLDNEGIHGTNPYPNVSHWYDSHLGINGNGKLMGELNSSDGLDLVDITQYLEVPTDFNEWYFICATYNPDVNERGSQADTDIPEYWLNHIVDDGTGTLIPIEFTNYSGYGNRSKVEIISRTDLLRARGFKV